MITYMLNTFLLSNEVNHFKVKCSEIKGIQWQRQKKIWDELPRNVAECTADNLRDTRTRKVLYTDNLNTIIRKNRILYRKNKPVHLNKNIQSKRTHSWRNPHIQYVDKMRSWRALTLTLTDHTIKPLILNNLLNLIHFNNQQLHKLGLFV